jgi:hypothetical protein
MGLESEPRPSAGPEGVASAEGLPVRAGESASAIRDRAPLGANEDPAARRAALLDEIFGLFPFGRDGGGRSRMCIECLLGTSEVAVEDVARVVVHRAHRDQASARLTARVVDARSADRFRHLVTHVRHCSVDTVPQSLLPRDLETYIGCADRGYPDTEKNVALIGALHPPCPTRFGGEARWYLVPQECEGSVGPPPREAFVVSERTGPAREAETLTLPPSVGSGLRPSTSTTSAEVLRPAATASRRCSRSSLRTCRASLASGADRLADPCPSREIV